MNKFGFIRTAAAVPVVSVADTALNTQRICRLIEDAAARQVSLLVFPSDCITGATCGDLCRQRRLLDAALNAVNEVAAFCCGRKISVIVGSPLLIEGKPQRCSIVISGGRVSAVVPEGENMLFDLDGVRISLAPCKSSHIVVRTAADSEDMFLHDIMRRDISAASSMDACAYIYCNAGFGESTTDNVYSGYSLICEGGDILAESESYLMDSQMIVADIDTQRIDSLHGYGKGAANVVQADNIVSLGETDDTDFSGTLFRTVAPLPFIADGDAIRRAFEIQAEGLASRLRHIGCGKVVIGVSGGLDSTLALLCAATAFDRMKLDRKGIIGITMPGFGTSKRTRGNAGTLMEQLGITHREVSIAKVCAMHLENIGHDGKTQDVAFENAQARERTMILMDIANMENAIVIGTGDLSELALGWCTYNGDHISNYSVNASIPKTLVREMVSYAAANSFKSVAGTLNDIIDTPVSPELKGDGNGIIQKTEDIVGPYELHDFFIWHMIGQGFSPEKTIFLASKAFQGAYSDTEIKKWMKIFITRFFSQQFKRSCSPDGPKVTPVSLSPRNGFNFPSDANYNIFIQDIN